MKQTDRQPAQFAVAPGYTAELEPPVDSTTDAVRSGAGGRLEPSFQAEGVTLYLGDCLDVLKTLESVQAVITDPPYGTGKLCTNGSSYKVKPKRENYDWDTWGESWIDAVKSDCKLIFTPPKQVVTMLQRDGARLLCAVSKQGVCVKNVSPRYGVQPIILLGKTPVNYAPDWLEFVNDGKRKLHPSQKPDNVMVWLVNMATDEGQTVCDPFMGSGTTGIACIRTRRKFIGIERDPEHFKTAVQRLSAELAQGSLSFGGGAEPVGEQLDAFEHSGAQRYNDQAQR